MDTVTQSPPLPKAPAVPKIPAKRKILYAALACLLTLLLAEGGLRVRAWIKYGTLRTGISDGMEVDDLELGMRVLRAGYEIKGQKTFIKINSLGFRGEEITSEKPPNTVRIVCLGASTTFCAEVSNNEAAWPHMLQEGLRRKYPNITVQVINAGVPGYIASESLKNLQHRVLPLQPDLVIYYEANNDIAHDTRNLAEDRGLIKSSETHLSPTTRRLSECSLLFDLVYKNSRIALSKNDSTGGKLEGLPKDLPNHFIAEIDRIDQELRPRDIPLVLSTFIVKYRRDQERAVQISNADVAFYYMPWMTIEDLLDAMDAYNDALVQYAHAHHIPIVEDRDSIPGDSQHYVDCVHMSDAGCARMADRFLRFFEEKKLIDQILEKRQRGK
jgi:hypothetical protein